jgi:hypothetical protein
MRLMAPATPHQVAFGVSSERPSFRSSPAVVTKTARAFTGSGGIVVHVNQFAAVCVDQNTSFDSVDPRLFVAVTTNDPDSSSVGVPDDTPVSGSIAPMPVGRVPEVSAYVLPPPVTTGMKNDGAPIVSERGVVYEIVGAVGVTTEKTTELLSVAPPGLVRVTLKEPVCSKVGVPLTMPVNSSTAMPAGTAPVVTECLSLGAATGEGAKMSGVPVASALGVG